MSFCTNSVCPPYLGFKLGLYDKDGLFEDCLMKISLRGELTLDYYLLITAVPFIDLYGRESD